MGKACTTEGVSSRLSFFWVGCVISAIAAQGQVPNRMEQRSRRSPRGTPGPRRPWDDRARSQTRITHESLCRAESSVRAIESSTPGFLSIPRHYKSCAACMPSGRATVICAKDSSPDMSRSRHAVYFKKNLKSPGSFHEALINVAMSTKRIANRVSFELTATL